MANTESRVEVVELLCGEEGERVEVEKVCKIITLCSNHTGMVHVSRDQFQSVEFAHLHPLDLYREAEGVRFVA